MIDKNGKLFGKVSIIDILIVVVLLAGLAFAAKFLGVFPAEQTAATGTEKIRITLYQEEVNTFTVENLKLNDPVTESMKNIDFGKVVDIKSDKSVSWGIDMDGKQVKSTKDGYSSVFITVEASGTVSRGGFTVNGTGYFIGQLQTFRAGTSAFYCRIYSVEKVKED